MPYKVLKDGATIQKKTGERVIKGKTLEVVKSFVYSEGDIIPDEDIAPSLLSHIESNGSDLLEKVVESEDKAEKPEPKAKAKKASKAK